MVSERGSTHRDQKKLARKIEKLVKADPLSGRDVPSSLRFEEMLGRKSLDRSLSKRERTRNVFMTIVARYIQENPAQNPTVEMVLIQTGLARSTFYNHFKDIDDCIFEVLNLFFEYIEGTRVSSSRDLSTFDAILEANTWYSRAYAANANLFAAIHRNSELGRVREQRNTQWAMKIVHVSGRRRGREFVGAERIEYAGTIRILITMTIEALRERFVANDTLLVQAFPTADDIAMKVSEIWYEVMKRYEQKA
jgi:AcrR family transcriptional regulator